MMSVPDPLRLGKHARRYIAHLYDLALATVMRVLRNPALRESLTHGKDCGLGTGGNAELVVDVLDVRGDRASADE